MMLFIQKIKTEQFQFSFITDDRDAVNLDPEI